MGNVTANMRCPKADARCFRLPYDILLILDSALWVLGKRIHADTVREDLKLVTILQNSCSPE